LELATIIKESTKPRVFEGSPQPLDPTNAPDTESNTSRQSSFFEILDRDNDGRIKIFEIYTMLTDAD